MLSLVRLASRVARFSAWIGGGLVVVAAFLTIVEILVRKVADQSLGGTSSLTGYLLACSSAWAFALTLIDRGHLRVDIFYFQLPRRLRGAIDVLALAALMAFTFVLLTQAWGVFHDSFKYTARDLTPLRVYLQYPQFIWICGLGFFAAVNLLLLVAAIAAFIAKDSATLNNLAAPTSANEELEAVGALSKEKES